MAVSLAAAPCLLFLPPQHCDPRAAPVRLYPSRKGQARQPVAGQRSSLPRSGGGRTQRRSLCFGHWRGPLCCNHIEPSSDVQSGGPGPAGGDAVRGNGRPSGTGVMRPLRQIGSSAYCLGAGAAAAMALPVILAASLASAPPGAAEALDAAAAGSAASAAGALPAEPLRHLFSLAPEPANALSLPTWVIHVSSVVEWITAMVLVWQYGDTKGRSAWKALAWGMVPLLAGAMCACTWHFYYNAESLEVLVALQGAMTVLGNCTIWIAAYRIYRQAQALA